VNVSIKRFASLIAADGGFKVRSVKGQRGKPNDKQLVEATDALNWWKENVNARPLDSVISGSRGVKSFITKGARLCLIEGDHIARHVTTDGIKIPNLSKTWSLPMNLQTFSAQHIEAAEGLEGTDVELLYWVPPAKFIQTLRAPKDPNVGKALKKLLGTKVAAALLKDGRYLLDGALLMHITNGGTGTEVFGESAIEPALPSIRYRRALDALEMTVITNLIARMVIIKVGSDNEASVYHKQEVSASRLGLLQRMMRNVGPSATILWAGPDIDVVSVSAHDALPDLTDRYKLAERRILMDLGIPAMLLIGEGGDGKAVANAAALAVASQLRELQDQYAQGLKSLAERILVDNGYEEVDVIWEWKENLLDNKAEAAELILKMHAAGLADTQTAIEELGFDFKAVETRMQADVTNGYREKAFGPPLAAQKPPAPGEGDGAGRPSKAENPTPDPRAGKETKSPESNK
jgi:hypothetical protein